MRYYEILKIKQNQIQESLEELIKAYKIEPVGKGYLELIVLPQYITSFIKQLAELGVIICGVSWWCYCTDESKTELGCPHGLGGPPSRYFDGWFSETDFYYALEEDEYERIKLIENSEEVFESNSRILKYILEDFTKDKNYSKCMTPSLCLHLPDGWKRIGNLE